MKMRQLLFLFLAFVLISATAEEKIIGTWEVYKAKGKKDAEKNFPKFRLTFEANETLIIKDLSDRAAKKAKYAYDESTKTLYIEDKPGRDAETMKIIKITNEKLILAPTKGKARGLDRLYLKKVG